MVIERSGTVAELHALDPFAERAVSATEVWWCRPTDDALVLGSRQTDDLVDADAAAHAGLAVVRRRSGGGAVLLRRDDVVWLDVVAPAGALPDDVRMSMQRVGDAWRDALSAHVDAPLVVHRGSLVEAPWSDLVCFAGVGPGEVLRSGSKLVGLSQRRSRHGVRVQGLVHLRDPSSEYATVLRASHPAGRPPTVGTIPTLDGAPLARALEAAIAARITTV